jgi:hypothetical protein
VAVAVAVAARRRRRSLRGVYLATRNAFADGPDPCRRQVLHTRACACAGACASIAALQLIFSQLVNAGIVDDQALNAAARAWPGVAGRGGRVDL